MSRNNSEITFKLYIEARLYYENTIQQQLEAEKYATELVLSCPNIHFYSFFNETDIITNPDNYKDAVHYGGWINSYILESMASRKHKITMETFEDYWKAEREFYLNYD